MEISKEEFTDLNLDRNLIEDAITESLPEKSKLKSKTQHHGLDVYCFSVEGEADALLNIYNKVNGTTTLVYKTGKNHEFSYFIALKIKVKCGLASYNGNSFYIKCMRTEDFQTLIEILHENGAEQTEKVNLLHGIQYKLRSRQGDKLSFNFFNNGAFNVQGKPLLLFSETIEILSELLPFKEVIEEQLKFYSSKISVGTVLAELENRIPTSYNYLDEKIITLISPSIALLKQGIELEDYTVFVFPILRGLEGIIKQIFKNNEILIVKQDTFGDYFRESRSGFILNTDSKEKIGNLNTIKALELLYTHFKKEDRNRLFHVEGTITPTRTLTRREAATIIDETLNLIEDVFVSFIAN